MALRCLMVVLLLSGCAVPGPGAYVGGSGEWHVPMVVAPGWHDAIRAATGEGLDTNWDDWVRSVSWREDDRRDPAAVLGFTVSRWPGSADSSEVWARFFVGAEADRRIDGDLRSWLAKGSLADVELEPFWENRTCEVDCRLTAVFPGDGVADYRETALAGRSEERLRASVGLVNGFADEWVISYETPVACVEATSMDGRSVEACADPLDSVRFRVWWADGSKTHINDEAGWSTVRGLATRLGVDAPEH